MTGWQDFFSGILTWIADAHHATLDWLYQKDQVIDSIKKASSVEMAKTIYDIQPQIIRDDPDVKNVYKLKTISLPAEAKNTGDVITDLLTTVSDTFAGAGKAIAETYMKIEPATPETALETALKLVSLDIGKDISIGVANFTSEIISAGQFETLADFWKFIGRKTGYGGPITMLMKAPIELGVISPLSKALHAQYRDKYLGSREALMLATKGHITDDILEKAFAYEGFPDWAIEAQLKDRYRELRLGELAWAMSDSAVSDTWLDDKLKAALYAPEDRPIIIGMLRERYMRTYRDRVASQLRNHYKEGYISAKDFRLKLTDLKVPLGVRDMIVQESDLMYRYDYNADLITTWMTQYKNDIINEDQLRGNLAKIIADPARVEGQVQKSKAARSPVPIAKPKTVTQGIRVSSKPSWSSIIIDEKDTGLLAPDTITTTAGRHTLVISMEGYEDASYDLNVPEGIYMEVHAELGKIGETI
jgi:hypothetical protein